MLLYVRLLVLAAPSARQLGHPSSEAFHKDPSCGATGAAPGCSGWCDKNFADRHCVDCQCSACGFCSKAVSCTPLPGVNDVSVQACQEFCNEQNKAQHCTRCACQSCDFCPGASSIEDRDVDCHIGQCSAFCDSMFKTQHCSRCECKACSFCHEDTSCTPLDEKDLKVSSRTIHSLCSRHQSSRYGVGYPPAWSLPVVTHLLCLRECELYHLSLTRYSPRTASLRRP